eukprot:Tbor_TRINITY_DN3006_c0_g1::TRINITY_DN3006_c0_g1_i1::g.17441::m.17441
MLAPNPTRRMNTPRQPLDPKIKQMMGVTHMGSFNCEARTFCPVGKNNVWVSERSGAISIRNARTGDILMCIDTGVRPLFANCMREIGRNVWIGSTDGRLCIYDINEMSLSAEVISPEVEHPSEIFELVTNGRSVFTSTAGARIDEWDVDTQSFVKSIILKGPVKGLTIVCGALISGDSTGTVVSWDVGTGEQLAVSSDNGISGVTAMVYEPTTQSVWVARENSIISVYNTKLDQLDVISEFSGKIKSFITVGGKVWGAGESKEVFVWHAYNRKLIGSFKDHNAFIFELGKVFTSETARVWSLSNDKSVHIYDGEGFFQPVPGVSPEDERNNALHLLINSQALQNAVLERRLASQAIKNSEFEKMRDTVVQQLTKIHDLEKVLELNEINNRKQLLDYTKICDDNRLMSMEKTKLQLQLELAEGEVNTLRSDLARLQEDIKRAGANAASLSAAAEREKTLYEAEMNCAKALLSAKDKTIELMRDDVKAARHQANEALCDRNKSMADLFRIKTEKEMESLSDDAIGRAEAARLREDMDQYEQEARAAQEELIQLRNMVSGQDKDPNFDRGLSHDALSTETKLKLQIDELNRQLEMNKCTIKALQDQYTIFQFVINSRGELVQHIWTLYNKIQDAFRTVSALDSGIRNYDKITGSLGGVGNIASLDRLTIKREWRTNIIDRSRSAVTALADSQRQVEYVVCNYFSDYEKMHLGLSVSKYQPDNLRPPIVGDDLLTKLRSTTLPKQFIASGGGAHSPSRNQTSNYVVNNSIAPTPCSMFIKPLPKPCYVFGPS